STLPRTARAAIPAGCTWAARFMLLILPVAKRKRRGRSPVSRAPSSTSPFCRLNDYPRGAPSPVAPLPFSHRSHAPRSGRQPMRPLLSVARERRLLQSAVLLAALIPICAGLMGVNGGLAAIDAAARWTLNGDSHVRYLSGLIFAIGVGFLSTVPGIEAC